MNIFNTLTMRNFSKIWALIMIGLVTFSCVEDDDFMIPETAPEAFTLPEGSSIITISEVLGQIDQGFDGSFTYSSDADDPLVFVEGFVISSDQAGNFFEEMVIQNATSNATAGIKVLIDDSPLSGFYQIGQRIYVLMNGLTVTRDNGVPVIGLSGSEGDVEKIPAPLRTTYVFRDNVVEEIEPTEIETASQFSDENLLTLIKMPAVQFSQEDLDDNRNFANEDTDQFDGLRLLQTCSDFFGAAIRLETSTFADFRGAKLLPGSGSVTAILNRDFEDDNFVLTVNSLADFDFDSDVRCDFDVISCGTAAAAGSNVILSEDFENVFNNPAEPAGWTNFVEAGSEFWETFTGADALGRTVRMGSFRSGDASSIGWLITPQIDFDAQSGEVFSFDNSNSFADGSEMQVLLSNDWDGTEANITSATWEPVADVRIVQNSDNFRDYFSSGNASLDCINGTGYIAFKYVGSGDSNSDGTYEVDNILLTSD